MRYLSAGCATFVLHTVHGRLHCESSTGLVSRPPGKFPSIRSIIKNAGLVYQKLAAFPPFCHWQCQAGMTHITCDDEVVFLYEQARADKGELYACPEVDGFFDDREHYAVIK